MYSVILWLVILFVLVIGTPLGLLVLARAINSGELFSPDVMLSMLISAYALEATIIIAFLIYYLQQKDALRQDQAQEEGGRRILAVELEKGLESVIRFPKAGATCEISSQLPQLLIAYLPYVQRFLQPEQLHCLIKIVDVLSHSVELAALEDSGSAAEYLQTHMSIFTKEQFLPVLCSPYAYRFALIQDYRCVLNDETRTVLERLTGNRFPQTSEKTLNYIWNQPFLEMEDDHRYKIYDQDGSLLCDAILNEDSTNGEGIESGWAKLRSYEGEFSGGLRNGSGCSYSLCDHHKLFDGIWKDDEEKDGLLYDMVVCLADSRADDSEFQVLFSYWNQTMIGSSIVDFLMEEDNQNISINDLRVGTVYQNQDAVRVDDTLLCPLKEFMEKNDPDTLSWVEATLQMLTEQP